MPGSIIAVEVLGLAAGSFEAIAVAFAINMVASAVVAKQLAPDIPNGSGSSPNPGSRQLVPPAGDNKLPVVYGSAYVGGTITDMTITADNKTLYYAIALSEVTNTEYGGTPDTITFGNIYYGGKLCQFAGDDPTKVVGLVDESTGLVDTTISGHLNIYCYPNGSNSASPSAISVMSASDLTYKWTSTNLMSNCAFAIVKLNYNSDAGVTSLQQTKFQITNSRTETGACFYDYMTSERYGAALLPAQIDTTSLAALTAYSNGSFTYTPSGGGTATQTRFKFDGVIDTDQSVMNNLQAMSSCCDCLIKYNEIVGKWGVIVQQPTYTVAMDINDTNMISSLSVTPIDLASSYNIAEVKFPDGSVKDSFNTATFDLAVVAPALLYPNEPVNKQVLNLPLVNNNVRAQYLANRFLKSAREDLQLQVRIDFSGLQLEAGDVVTVTNANYGWTAKPFRITKVTESFADDGTVTAALFLSEFNASVYDDVSVTAFTPAANTGLSNPAIYGNVPAPVVSNVVNSGYRPAFDVTITTSSAGITQYAELWYSTVSNPTSTQLTLAGTSEIAPNGNPYAPNTVLPAINIAGLAAGTYYFFSRMRNSLRASPFSPASIALVWNPVWIGDVQNFVSAGNRLSWSPVENYRLAGYKIRFQYGVNYDWGSANNLFDGVITPTVYDASGLPSTRLTILIKAIDTEGHESINANSLVYTPGGVLNSNTVYTYDFKANGWPGTIVNGSVVGGNIVATTTDSFYGYDDQSFYGLDTASFYDLTSVNQLTYTTSQIYVTGALLGSLGALTTTLQGKDATIEYRRVSGVSFYGPDADSLYGAVPTDSFYAPDSDWSLMPGTLAMANDYYQFRVTIGAGVIGEIDAMYFTVDAPSIVEVLSNYTVNGTAIAYTKSFTNITAVLATLQTNALGVVSLETDKSSPLAPKITGYNSAHTATVGAKADITLQGY
jgi:Putative phage tail protein